MPQGTPKRFLIPASTLLTEEDGARIDLLTEIGQVSRSDVLRDVIGAGLPVVEREYRQKQLRRELPDVEPTAMAERAGSG